MVTSHLLPFQIWRLSMIDEADLSENEIQIGKYRGWHSGIYDLLNDDFGLLTHVESENYFRELKKWNELISNAIEKDEKIESFVSLDGSRYPITESVFEIFKNVYNFKVSLNEYLMDNKISVSDAMYLYIHFPFTDGNLSKWRLNADGTIEPLHIIEKKPNEYFTDTPRNDFAIRRKLLIEDILKSRKLRWGSVSEPVSQTDGIVQLKQYRGWQSGDYLYSIAEKALLTKAESKRYSIDLTNWKNALEEKNRLKQFDTTIVGIDGIERKIPEGLIGVTTREDCLRETCKRFKEGKVSWPDLKEFLIFFPYSPPRPQYATLTLEGNSYRAEERFVAHPWSFSELFFLSIDDYLTKEQQFEIKDGHVEARFPSPNISPDLDPSQKVELEKNSNGFNLLHRFWIHYEGTYHELVKDFEEAFDNRWRFNGEIEDVSPNSIISFDNGEISIQFGSDRNPEYPNYNIFESTSHSGLEIEYFDINYTIDFRSQYLSDTLKTRRHLKEIANKIPGTNAIFTNANKWIFGQRKNGIWQWADEEDTHQFAMYNTQKATELMDEEDSLEHTFRSFLWEKYSMFDSGLYFPFTRRSGLTFDRLDWQLETDESIENVVELLGKCFPKNCEIYAVWDLDHEYTTVKIIYDRKWLFRFVVQPSTNFVTPGYELYKPNTLIVSLYAKNFGDEESQKNSEILSVIENAIKGSGFKATLYKNLSKVVKMLGAS